MATIWRTATTAGTVSVATLCIAQQSCELWDVGYLISSQPWIDASTVSAAPVVATYDGYWLNGHRIASRLAAPATGTWSQGDIVYNSTPTVGAAQGWTCVAGGTPGTWTSFAAANYVNSVASLQDGNDDGDVVVLLGYYTPGDGGSGLLRWNASSTDTANNGTIFAIAGVSTGRWMRIYDDGVNVRWFGAKGDGVVNDSPAIQAMIDFSESAFCEMYFPAGSYLVGSRLYLNATAYDFTYRFSGASGMNTQLIISDDIGGGYALYVNTEADGSVSRSVGNNPRVVM
jgi:hypothetical protein